MTNTIVYVIDDDAIFRDSLEELLKSAGLTPKGYQSAERFLEEMPQTRGCIVSDVRMPGMTGLQLQSALKGLHATLPLILITAHGDIAMAVAAVKAGAWDFIEKPFDDEILLDSIQRALAEQPADRGWEDMQARLESLTQREREVMELLVIGQSNKRIAQLLGISDRTVEIHKARVLRKMEATNLAELIRMNLQLDR